MNWLRRRLGMEHTTVGLLPLFVLFGLNAVDELDQAAFAVLIPEISDEFGLDLNGLLRLVSLLAFVALLVGLPLGYLADRFPRLRMARLGALVWAAFSVLTGGATSLWMLGIGRSGAGLGRAVNAPTHESLLADYYPPDERPGAYATHRAANSVGQFVGPLAAGGLAYLFGWRTPFFLLAVPTLLFVVLSLRLREPVRGRHEREAGGADESLATLEDEAPSWEESWRLVRSIGTLRRIWYAIPFLIGGILSITVLTNVYYDDVFGIGPLGRGIAAAVTEPFQLAGLAVGIPVATKAMQKDPVQLFRLVAVAATAGGFGFVGFALAPTFTVAVGFACFIAFSLAVVAPGVAVLTSLILPPKARSFGFVIGRLWALPGVGVLAAIGSIASAWGLRTGILLMVPLFLTGAAILASAGSQIHADIKANNMAALAAADMRAAREAGRAKLLVCRGIDVHYGQVQVLFGVDLDVEDGEIVALLGTNGAGKSTVLKAIAGVTDPSGGAVVFDGADCTFATAPQKLARGLVYMPGGRAVFPGLTVAENLQAATWLRAGDPAIEGELEAMLDRFPRLRERYDQPAGNLSGGEQQMLGLSMAFLSQPKLLLIDELSLGLAPVIVEQLLQLVREIHARGTTVVIVEQSVNVALTIAERAVFLEKGEVRFEGPTRDLLDRPDVLRSVFLEGALASSPAEPRAALATTDDGPRETWLRTTDLSISFGGIHAVRNVSIDVRAGEIVGLIGANGAGKTTLMDLISGFLTPTNGGVELLGRDVTSLSPHRRADLGLGRSFQDARMFPSMTVREVLALAHDRHLRIRGFAPVAFAVPDQQVEEQLLAARVEALIELTGLGAFADKFISELSTGTRRIVDIACAIAHEPKVLLVDEPSSGIAQRETEALGPLLRRISEGLDASMIVIEHDMPLITGLCDRLIALETGAVVVEGSATEVLAHPRVVASYLGGDDIAVNRSGAAAPPTRSRRRQLRAPGSIR